MKGKLIECVKTCPACPSQWEGKLEDGRMVYMRYRWGYFSCSVSEKKTDNVMKAVKGEEIIGKSFDNTMDGIMDDVKMLIIISDVFEITEEVKSNLNETEEKIAESFLSGMSKLLEDINEEGE